MAWVQQDGSGNVTALYGGPQPGNVAVVQLADNDPRIAAFNNPKSATLAQRLAAGCTISSTANPVLNHTFALDDDTMTQIGAVARDSAAGLGLPLGASTFTYPDIHGAPVTCTAAQIQALYKGLRDFVAATQGFVAGQIPQAPATPFVIP